MLGDKEAVSVLFEEIAPRFADRDGGYTRILRLSQPRLGDAGAQAILEFVGQNDRITEKAERPAFDGSEVEDETEDEAAAAEAPEDESTETQQPAVEEKAAAADDEDPAADEDEKKEGQ